MLEHISNVTDYLKTFGPALAEKIKRSAEPLFHPGQAWDPKMDELLRKPFVAQGDVVMGLCNAMQEQKSAIICGEMGTGKCLLSLATTYVSKNGAGPARTLIMCPGHLVKKWQREVLNTVPGAQAFILRKLKDAMALNPNAGKPKTAKYYVISKDRAKLSYAWRPAFIQHKGKKGLYCPDCGSIIMDNDDCPVEQNWLQRQKRFCKVCRGALWQADNTKFRRFAVAEYLKRYFKNYFDYAIFDEVHELKSQNSAQGNAFGALSSAAKKSIALTGTLTGGYADDLRAILFRLNPDTLLAEGIRYHDVSKFVSRYGVLERINRYRLDAEDNISSRGKKGSSIVKRRPGISPQIFGQHLMGSTAFLRLEDIALNLPPFSEQVIACQMDRELAAAYFKLQNELIAAVRAELQRGSKRLLSTYLQTLLSYPDRPFGNEPIVDRGNEHERVAAIPVELSRDTIYTKEQRLVELVREELRQKRRVFVFCHFTATKDVTERLKRILTDEGIKTDILKSAVPPENREEWILEREKEGVECLIAGIKLVETGVDLLAWPTLVFYQCSYSIYSLRQASRRSWRIGQTRDVKVYYMFYQDTLSEKALQLIGSKLSAALSIEGQFSEEGLMAMTSGEDMSVALAKALVDGLEGEGVEQIWKSINEANKRPGQLQEKSKDVGKDETDEQEPTLINEKAGDEPLEPEKIVFVDFVTFLGRRKKVERKSMKAQELNQPLEGTKTVAQLALFG